LLKNYPPKQK
jgi:hypothetical protein